MNARQKSSLQIARELAADAVALSKEHAGRADAAEGRWQALREWLEEQVAIDVAGRTHLFCLPWRAVLAEMAELDARDGPMPDLPEKEAGE